MPAPRSMTAYRGAGFCHPDLALFRAERDLRQIKHSCTSQQACGHGVSCGLGVVKGYVGVRGWWIVRLDGEWGGGLQGAEGLG